MESRPQNPESGIILKTSTHGIIILTLKVIFILIFELEVNSQMELIYFHNV